MPSVQVVTETSQMEFDTSSAAERRLTRSDMLVILLFTALYVPYVAHAAVTRPFWVDELFTFYVVTMPDWNGVMDLVWRGADQNPPLFHAVTRLVVLVLGESEWAFRLPAMVGYWVFCVTLYLWVRLLGGGQTAALVAMTTPVFTNVVYYASEARPYGLMLGCFGVALVCYAVGSIYGQQPDYCRRAWLGLGASLSLAMAFHYLALIPIGCLWLVEAYRTWRIRQWRWAVWAALFVPLAVLAYNWSIFVEQSRLPYWKTQVSWSELTYFYSWMLGVREYPAFLGRPLELLDMRQAWMPNAWVGSAFLVVIGLALALAWHSRRVAHEPASPVSQRNAPEWLVSGLVLAFGLPVGWMVLMQVTGKTMFTPRYLLPAVAGLAILLAFSVWHLKMRPARILATGIWMLLATLTLWANLQPWQLVRPSIKEIADLPNPTQPILLNLVHFLTIKHYYPNQLPVMCVWGITNKLPPKELAGRGPQALLQNPRAPRFEGFDSFLETHHRLYIRCHKVDDKEMVQKLKNRQMPVIRETDEYIVYEFFKRNISTRPSLPHRIQPSQ